MLFTFSLQMLSFVMKRPVSNGLSRATLCEPLSVTLTLEAIIFSKVFFQFFFSAAYKAPYFYLFIQQGFLFSPLTFPMYSHF